MKTKTTKVAGYRMSIPAYFDHMKKGPEEFKGLNAHVAQTENASCLLLFDYEKSLPAAHVEIEAFIRTIHDNILRGNQGLVAAEVGETNGRDYRYSILKTLLEDNGASIGVEYNLTMLIAWKNGVVRIRGTFKEQGATGMRDSAVLAMRSSELGSMDAALEGWAKDPYDPSRTVGALMNMSEREEFDPMFPAHPLSIARDTVRCILGQGIDRESQAAEANDGESDAGAAVPRPNVGEKLFGKVAGAAGGMAEKVGKTAGAVVGTASDAAGAVAKAAGSTADAIGNKVEEIKAAKDEPDEYDRAVIVYNMAYTDLSDAGLDLFQKRERSVDLMGHVEHLINSIANRPKSYDRDLGEIASHKHEFKEAEEFARQELDAARQSAMGAGAGLAAGMAVASMAPSAALWVATTFGTASTGTAISTLSGAAATNAALAWLGGGALAAGGGGMAAGNAFLAMAGPIGWGIAGATLLTSILLFAKKKHDILGERQKELTAVKKNTERVTEMGIEVESLAKKTEELRLRLGELYSQCIGLFGSDFSVLSVDDQDRLATMVNDTLALSRLLSERLTQGEPSEGQVDE